MVDGGGIGGISGGTSAAKTRRGEFAVVGVGVGVGMGVDVGKGVVASSIVSSIV